MQSAFENPLDVSSPQLWCDIHGPDTNATMLWWPKKRRFDNRLWVRPATCSYTWRGDPKILHCERLLRIRWT